MQVCKDIDTVYFIENNHWIKEAEIIAKRGDLYILRFDGYKGTCLRARRLFPTYELAEQSIHGRAKAVGYRAPMLY